jgi:hypothetical protein
MNEIMWLLGGACIVLFIILLVLLRSIDAQLGKIEKEIKKDWEREEM